MTNDDRDKFILFLEELISGAQNALERFSNVPDAAKQQRKIDAARMIIEELRAVEVMEHGS